VLEAGGDDRRLIGVSGEQAGHRRRQGRAGHAELEVAPQHPGEHRPVPLRGQLLQPPRRALVEGSVRVDHAAHDRTVGLAPPALGVRPQIPPAQSQP
jgi:hypothetical protein